MSQSKEKSGDSPPDGGRDDDVTALSEEATLTLRLCELLDQRTRLLEQVVQVDREIDRVRSEASDIAHRAAERLREATDDRSFIVLLEDFVRGAADPPEEVDRDDFEHCLGKVVLALRRRGESLARAQAQVRFQPTSGRIVAIAFSVGDEGTGERPIYRRFDLVAASVPG